MNGITKLEISCYAQWGQARPLENAFYNATGECSDIEIENNLFVTEDGELYKASDELIEWYKKSYYNTRADDICIIIDHDNRTAFIAENPDDYHDPHERKWRRYSVTLYYQDKEKEFTNFGDEYDMDEIRSKADEMLEKYVGKKSGKWKQTGQTHSKHVRDYSIEVYVIP